MITSPYKIIPYARRYRRELMALLLDDERLHIHLDWNTIEEWLAEPDVPIFLAWEGQTLVGAIAAAPPLEHSTWIRLVVIERHANLQAVLAELWSMLRVDLLARDIQEVAILLLRPWLMRYIDKIGFEPMDTIVTLRRDSFQVPKPLRGDVKLLRAAWHEADLALEVDHGAFAPIWQLHRASLRQASRTSARFTLAELNDRLVGYELSTMYRDGAHLARLATIPDVQGSGIGGAMLTAMIQSFLDRGVSSVTVNTQSSNIQSLNLYRRYGFDLTGLNMDVWSIVI
jgi:[ribosomal protein S18]-alanine N-acetyltransferase